MAEKKATERDTGNIDIAAVMAILVKDDGSVEFGTAVGTISQY